MTEGVVIGFEAHQKEPLDTPRLERKMKEPINDESDTESYAVIELHDEPPEPERSDFRAISIIGTISLISSLIMHTISQSAYAYLKEVDPTRSEVFFHYMFAFAKLAQVIVLVVCSFLTNHFNNYRLQLLCGRIVAILGLFIYFITEIFPETTRRWVLFISFILVGLSDGTLVIVRGYGPKFSTAADRSAAMGILTGAGLGGILFGPMINLIFSIGKTNGNVPAKFLGVELTFFTIPIIILIFLNCLALIFVFLVKEPLPSDTESTKKRSSSMPLVDRVWDSILNIRPWFNEKLSGIDGRLLAVCLVLKAISAGSFFAALTCTMQHMTATYNMTPQENVKWMSVNQILAGLIAASVSIAFTIGKIGKKQIFRPTLSLIYAFLLFGCLGPLSFNWPFAEPLVIADHVTAPNGCNSTALTWCEETSLINPFAWMLAAAFFIGASMPLSLIAQDTMYSRVLERSERQDLFQGLFAMVECLTLFVVPMVSGSLYILIGPIKFYGIIGAVQVLTVLAFVLIKGEFDRVIEAEEEEKEEENIDHPPDEDDVVISYKYVPTPIEALIGRR